MKQVIATSVEQRKRKRRTGPINGIGTDARWRGNVIVSRLRHRDGDGFPCLKEHVHGQEFHLPEHTHERDEDLLPVTSTGVESVIHNGVTEVHPVAVLHGKEAVSAVGCVRDDRHVEGGHPDDVSVVFERSIGHRNAAA